MDGVAPALVREALLLLVPFAGVPRTLDALNVFATVHPDVDAHRDPRAPAAWRADGERLFAQVYAANTERVLAGLRSADPELPDWVLEHAYGKVLARGVLRPDQVECLAVVLLAVQGLTRQLKGHIAGALACGAPEALVRSCLAAAAAWIGPAERERAERLLVSLATPA